MSLPSEKTLTCTSDTVDELKTEIFNKCGRKQYLYCRNKPLCSNITAGSNVHVLYKLCGGNDECDICAFPGGFQCSECGGQITCKEYCEGIHKHPNHKPLQLLGRTQNSCTTNTACASPTRMLPDHTYDEFTYD